MRDLFTRVARPLAGPDTPGSWLAGRRLMSIDGTVLDLADSAVNAEFFGRPPVSRGSNPLSRKHAWWRWRSAERMPFWTR